MLLNVDYHIAAGGPNYVIYYKIKWVSGDPTYTIYMKQIGLVATKFNIILNGFDLNTTWT